jgi:hypothetical protein
LNVAERLRVAHGRDANATLRESCPRRRVVCSIDFVELAARPAELVLDPALLVVWSGSGRINWST